MGCHNWLSISLFISMLNFFLLSAQRLRRQSSKASRQSPPILSCISSHYWTQKNTLLRYKQPSDYLFAPAKFRRNDLPCLDHISLIRSSNRTILMHWTRKEKNYISITIQKASEVQIQSELSILQVWYFTSPISYQYWSLSTIKLWVWDSICPVVHSIFYWSLNCTYITLALN